MDALEGRDLVVTGVVAELPRANADGTRFVFAVDTALDADGNAVTLPPRLSLGWWRYDDADVASGTSAAPPLPALPALRAGQRWRLPLRLKQPHGALNPHGFDAERWLFDAASAPAAACAPRAAAPLPVLLAERDGLPCNGCASAIGDAIARAVPEPFGRGSGGVAVATKRRSNGPTGSFSRHRRGPLMEISGLHVTMLAWLAAAIVDGLWRRIGVCRCCWRRRTAARWGGWRRRRLRAAGRLGHPAQRTCG